MSHATDASPARADSLAKAATLDAAGVDLPEPIQRLRLERRPRPSATRDERDEAAPDTEADSSVDRQIADDLASGDENLLST